MSKENADLKSKVDASEKKLNISFEELGKKLFGPSNEHDKTKKIEKIKTSNNSLKKIIDESKELLKTIKKNDENKKYTSADESNVKAEDINNINKLLKDFYRNEAQKASKEVERFNKMIDDNLDMSSEKSEIINRLTELYSLRRLYYLNNANNNWKANEKMDNILIDREINELGKRLRDQHKKGSGMFTLLKAFVKLLTFLAQLYAGNNSKKLKNDINRLLKALYNSKNKQISI